MQTSLNSRPLAPQRMHLWTAGIKASRISEYTGLSCDILLHFNEHAVFYSSLPRGSEFTDYLMRRWNDSQHKVRANHQLCRPACIQASIYQFCRLGVLFSSLALFSAPSSPVVSGIHVWPCPEVERHLDQACGGHNTHTDNDIA